MVSALCHGWPLRFHGLQCVGICHWNDVHENQYAYQNRYVNVLSWIVLRKHENMMPHAIHLCWTPKLGIWLKSFIIPHGHKRHCRIHDGVRDDVIKWKHFPRYWPFVRGIHRPVTRSFGVFFDLRLNKRLSKQPWGRWFGTASCSLWRHCNVNEATSYSKNVKIGKRMYNSWAAVNLFRCLVCYSLINQQK